MRTKGPPGAGAAPCPWVMPTGAKQKNLEKVQDFLVFPYRDVVGWQCGKVGRRGCPLFSWEGALLLLSLWRRRNLCGNDSLWDFGKLLYREVAPVGATRRQRKKTVARWKFSRRFPRYVRETDARACPHKEACACFRKMGVERAEGPSWGFQRGNAPLAGSRGSAPGQRVPLS